MGMDALKEHYRQAGMKSNLSFMLEVVKLVGGMLIALFATISSAEAAIESVAPISGGTVWTTNFPPGGTFASAEAACGSMNASSCPICGSLSYVGVRPNPAYPNYRDCVVFYNPGDGTPGWNTLSGTALSSSNAVCPVPAVNPTVPYQYDGATKMCIRTVPDCPANSSGTPPACTCNSGYEFDASKSSCIPVDCPVPKLRDVKDIPPNGPDVLPLTLRLENTKGSDLALLPAAEEGIACLKRKTTGVFVSSGTRTLAYQAHLKEIWDKLIDLDALEDPAEIKACKPLRDKVLAEKGGCSNNSGHCLRFQPATDSKHTIGKAFDVRTDTINALLLKLRPVPPLPLKLPLTPAQQRQADVKLIADFLAKPAACSLNWGGSFGDDVHFSVP